MKRYNLLTEKDLIPNNHYEVISLFGKNPHPRREVAFYNRYRQWCGIEDNHTILEIIHNSVMLVLAKENSERYKEVVLGGYYDDGKYNDERSKSSYKDCEELYPIKQLFNGGKNMYEIYNAKGIYVCCTDNEDEAIKYIAENGGSIKKKEINMEDKCVWEYEEKNQFYYKAISPHKNLDCMIDNSSKWKYCPYCGKQIEYNKSKCNTV